MKCIINPFSSCFLNIASEEYFLSNFDDDIFYLYINSPCIVVGRYQNTYSEINQDYVRDNHIDVVRRQSGGGAVYHDHGNLNYGFIFRNTGKDIDTVFREFTQPIIGTLKKLGANASFSGRNDLVIGNKKISGVAQFHTSEKVLLHGTLLFDSDLGNVAKSLNADPRKFQDKSTKSVKSRVANIRPFLSRPITIEELMSQIVEDVRLAFPGAKTYQLTKADQNEIKKIAEEKYTTWEWVYGCSPKFTCQHSVRYDNGILDVGLNVESGMIVGIDIFGDFFIKKDIGEVKQCLTNIPYEQESVETALRNIHLEDYIFKLTNEVFVDSLFSNSLSTFGSGSVC